MFTTETCKYNQQPTLLIGLGGFGSRTVDNIYGKRKEKNNITAFAIDTDINDLQIFNHIPMHNTIALSQAFTVKHCLELLPEATQWYPNNPLLYNKSLCEGSGQVRANARLAYEIALKHHSFDRLLDELFLLAHQCKTNNTFLRVSIITSLSGGTGSGIFIQIALLIREHVNAYFPDLNIEIHGEFILPSNFLYMYSKPKIERRFMESNAYAALKELNAIDEHIYNNFSPLELRYGYIQADNDKTHIDTLPYNYCFLYDKINNDKFNGGYIEEAIIERLFSPSAHALDVTFTKGCNADKTKKPGNSYGTVSTEKLPLGSTILSSEIFRSIINRTSFDSGNRILIITSPFSLDIDTEQLPQNTEFIERTDPTADEITITELCYKIEIAKLDKFILNDGQYFKSYNNVITRLPEGITPHLNINWHNILLNIGEKPSTPIVSDSQIKAPNNITEGAYVFISYSTKDADIANQLRHILETNGIPCWMAPKSIPAGSDYGTEIPKAIKNCKVFLLLLSSSSQTSEWVPKEVGLAIGKGKVVIPFQIDNAAISDAFDFYLTNSQRIDAYNRTAEAYRELIERLMQLLTE
ncbi:MAG: TIR domain-containing protein [Ruminococcaceae bacterium]|nr:TIR domain-containing protein [Oscillospiraceae bacterium]